MKRVMVVVLLSGLIALLTMGLSGCGSSTQPIAVGITSSGNGTDQAQAISITATVTHDAKGAGVQWSVSGGGTLSSQTPTSVTYNAPASVTSAFTATVTAASIRTLARIESHRNDLSINYSSRLSIARHAAMTRMAQPVLSPQTLRQVDNLEHPQ